MTIETIRFRNDTLTRKRLMVPESFQHPAKGQLGMWAMMVERYSQPGDLVLDPMAGSGATLLAALMGRNVICVELEQHFVEPMRQSWAKMRTMPMLGHEMGQAVILRGDARCLPLPDASVGAAITSPPYEGSLVQEQNGIDADTLKQPYGPNSQFARPQSYTRHVDAIVTSPPYEGVADSTKNTNTNDAARGFPTKPMTYTRPVDTIVTSPPFQDQEPGQDKEWLASYERSNGKPAGIGKALLSGYTRPVDAIAKRRRSTDAKRLSIRVPKVPVDRRQIQEPQEMPAVPSDADTLHGGTSFKEPCRENIGNMKGSQYFEAMRLCYAECWRVLRPGGIMALVLKGFTRDGKYVDLPGQTEALLLEAGWQRHDHWRRELWSLSFWRILQKRRDPAAWDDRLMYEEVLAFKKPGGEGYGVDAVITSPPYEASVSDGKEGPGQTSVPGGWKADVVNKHGGYTV